MVSAFFNDAHFREKKLATWLTIGLLVFVTAFLWAPSRDGLEAIYALAIFIPWLLLMPWRKSSWVVCGGWFTLLALLYAGYSVTTGFWAATSTPGFFILQWLVLASWLCGLCWMASRGLIDISRLVNTLLLVGALVSVINLVVFYSTNPWAERLEGWSVTRNPNHIGSTFGILTLLGYIEWLKAKTTRHNWYFFLLMVLCFISVLATQSRSALLGLTFLGPIAALLYCRSLSKWILQLMGLLCLVGIAYLLQDQFYAVLSARGVSLRDSIWSDVFALSVQEHFWWGRGLEKEGRIILSDGSVYNHAHNAWLDILYRTGLTGLGLSLVYLFYLLRSALMRPQIYPLLLWLLYGCCYSLFDSRGFFWQIDPKWFCFWVPAGLIGALLSASARQPHSNQDNS